MMARVVEEIKVDLYHLRALDALENAFETWPQSKIDQFRAEWSMLASSGAELAECRFVGGRVVAYPSEDFTLHLASWGIHL